MLEIIPEPLRCKPMHTPKMHIWGRIFGVRMSHMYVAFSQRHKIKAHKTQVGSGIQRVQVIPEGRIPSRAVLCN